MLPLKEREHLTSAMVNIIENYMNEAFDNDDFFRVRPLITHIEAFLNHGNLLNKESEATLSGILGCIYGQLGYFEKPKDLLTKAIADLNQMKNKDYTKISKGLGFLGLLYSSLGDYKKGIYFLEESYKQAQNDFDKNHTIIVFSLEHLGSLYRSLGQYDKSLQLLEKSLTICKKYFPKNHVKVGGALVF